MTKALSHTHTGKKVITVKYNIIAMETTIEKNIFASNQPQHCTEATEAKSPPKHHNAFKTTKLQSKGSYGKASTF